MVVLLGRCLWMSLNLVRLQCSIYCTQTVCIHVHGYTACVRVNLLYIACLPLVFRERVEQDFLEISTLSIGLQKLTNLSGTTPRPYSYRRPPTAWAWTTSTSYNLRVFPLGLRFPNATRFLRIKPTKLMILLDHRHLNIACPNFSFG